MRVAEGGVKGDAAVVGDIQRDGGRVRLVVSICGGGWGWGWRWADADDDETDVDVDVDVDVDGVDAGKGAAPGTCAGGEWDSLCGRRCEYGERGCLTSDGGDQEEGGFGVRMLGNAPLAARVANMVGLMGFVDSAFQSMWWLCDIAASESDKRM